MSNVQHAATSNILRLIYPKLSDSYHFMMVSLNKLIKCAVIEKKKLHIARAMVGVKLFSLQLGNHRLVIGLDSRIPDIRFL